MPDTPSVGTTVVAHRQSNAPLRGTVHHADDEMVVVRFGSGNHIHDVEVPRDDVVTVPSDESRCVHLRYGAVESRMGECAECENRPNPAD